MSLFELFDSQSVRVRASKHVCVMHVCVSVHGMCTGRAGAFGPRAPGQAQGVGVQWCVLWCADQCSGVHVYVVAAQWFGLCWYVSVVAAQAGQGTRGRQAQGRSGTRGRGGRSGQPGRTLTSAGRTSVCRPPSAAPPVHRAPAADFRAWPPPMNCSRGAPGDSCSRRMDHPPLSAGSRVPDSTSETSAAVPTGRSSPRRYSRSESARP